MWCIWHHGAPRISLTLLKMANRASWILKLMYLRITLLYTLSKRQSRTASVSLEISHRPMLRQMAWFHARLESLYWCLWGACPIIWICRSWHLLHGNSSNLLKIWGWHTISTRSLTHLIIGNWRGLMKYGVLCQGLVRLLGANLRQRPVCNVVILNTNGTLGVISHRVSRATGMMSQCLRRTICWRWNMVWVTLLG